MSEFLLHGGARDAAMRRFGGAPGDWLDLSTGIDPCPPAIPPIPPDSWTRLPEGGEVERLGEAFRRFAGASAAAEIVAASGSGALIAALPRLVRPGVAATLRFTYGGHAAALEAAGHRVAHFDEPAAVPADARLVLLANPNNPDGRRFPARELLALAASLAERGGFLVVDEAFMDADPRESLSAEAGRGGIVVLRSFGKFFGLAGLRLGFALVPPALAPALRAALGEWPVSGPAIAVGQALMANDAEVEQRRARIRHAARRTREAIRTAGLDPAGDAALFALVRHARAPALFKALARRHVLVRPFRAESEALRIGLCADEREAERLGAALREATVEAAA